MLSNPTEDPRMQPPGETPAVALVETDRLPWKRESPFPVGDFTLLVTLEKEKKYNSLWNITLMVLAWVDW